MRRTALGVVAAALLLASTAQAQSQRAIRHRMANDPTWRPVGQAWSPAWGYSTVPNGGGYYGNAYGDASPFQGNIRFPDGFGWGSIYGTKRPGYTRFVGPSWGNPAGW